jgi:hypothetical protein
MFFLLARETSGKPARRGRSFGGFTESQIRTNVSGSGLSLVKWVKVELVVDRQPAFAAQDEVDSVPSLPLPLYEGIENTYERRDEESGSGSHIRRKLRLMNHLDVRSTASESQKAKF